MGTVSKLASGVYIAHSNNYQKGRNGYKICKITPHMMAGKLTGKQCAVNIFQNPNRIASANYCIGNDGDIVCNVYEENRAFTSGNRLNDWQAITIEVSNNVNKGPNWTISDKAWKSLVNLCVDICKRYKFKLTYDGTRNGSLTRHNMFQSTDCPGKYLQSKFPDLVKEVNAKLDGKEEKKTYTRYVKVSENDVLNVRSGIGVSNKIVKTLKNGTKVTVYETKNGWSRIGTNQWVNSAYLTTIKNTVGQTKVLKSLTTLWSKSNLSGTKYTYLPQTTVIIKKNISNTVDYIYIPKTGRYAYCKNNVYK